MVLHTHTCTQVKRVAGEGHVVLPLRFKARSCVNVSRQSTSVAAARHCLAFSSLRTHIFSCWNLGAPYKTFLLNLLKEAKREIRFILSGPFRCYTLTLTPFFPLCGFCLFYSQLKTRGQRSRVLLTLRFCSLCPQNCSIFWTSKMTQRAQSRRMSTSVPLCPWTTSGGGLDRAPISNKHLTLLGNTCGGKHSFSTHSAFR